MSATRSDARPARPARRTARTARSAGARAAVVPSGFVLLLGITLLLNIFCADVLCRRARRIDDGLYALAPVLVTFGVCAFLIMAQPDKGTTLIVGAIVFAVMFVGGVRLRSMVSLFAFGGFGAFALGV